MPNKLRLAIGAIGAKGIEMLDTPADGLTIRQAEAIAHSTKKILRETVKMNEALDHFTRTNTYRLLRGDD